MKRIATVPTRSALRADASHVEAFKALAHLTRLEVFFFLVRAAGEVPAGEIQQALEVPGPTLSHHLDALRRAGLVKSRREERYIYYSVRRDTATALVRLFTACC
jgi:ArsR family transcriptional regulator, arsenate/arsenite/antimonite-responsive transcriptional repressor